MHALQMNVIFPNIFFSRVRSKKFISSCLLSFEFLFYLTLTAFLAIQIKTERLTSPEKAALEVLQTSIPAEFLEHYITTDELIWTKFLKKQQGFRTKLIVLDPTSCNYFNITENCKIFHLILWESRNLWKSIPSNDLKATELLFETLYKHSPPNVIAIPDDNGFDVLAFTDLGTQLNVIHALILVIIVLLSLLIITCVVSFRLKNDIHIMRTKYSNLFINNSSSTTLL